MLFFLLSQSAILRMQDSGFNMNNIALSLADQNVDILQASKKNI